MDRWIYAICGREPVWHLAPLEQVIETITQQFGVGAGSLGKST